MVEQIRPCLTRAEGEKMKRQIAKGLTMLMLVVGLAFASAAVANGQGNHLTAQIPFDFIVADKTLTSGQYQVRRQTDSGVIVIRDADGKNSLMRLTNEASGRRDMGAKLVFHRYGSTYFLSQVWINGSGRELARSKQERAAERELKAIAAYHGDTKPVYEVVELIATAR
jgi:hypothetical protein